MKMNSDEMIERAIDEYRMQHAEYSEYVAKLKKASVASFKLTLFWVGSIVLLSVLFSLFHWQILLKIVPGLMTIVIFGGLSVIFVYKVAKPVIKMFVDYILSIWDKIKTVINFLLILPFICWIVYFWLIVMLLYIIGFIFVGWCLLAPLYYVWAYFYYKKKVKALETLDMGLKYLKESKFLDT